MNRKKIIYLTDFVLVPLFILTLYTGIKLHVAGHDVNHEIWHNWAIFHTIVSLLFTISGIIHVKAHWTWYKGLKTKGMKGKSKSVLMLSLTFIPIVITGISLLYIEGANSSTGLLHYKTGLIAGISGIVHILKRLRFLVNGFTTILAANKNRRH